MEINVKKLREEAKLPTAGTEYAAGYDLYAVEDTVIPAGDSKPIHTGLSMAIPKWYAGYIFARSGLARKEHLRPSNCVGVIDPDYRGEIIVDLFNDTDQQKVVSKGERVAQIVFLERQISKFTEVSELTATSRGEGGFGSTGMN